MSWARLALLLAAVPAMGQTLPAGPQVLTYFSAVDDSDQPYAIYVPAKFDSGKRYPLVVSLHGAGSNHRLNLRRVFGKGNLRGETDAEATRRFPPLPEVDFFVVSPLARGTIGYQGIGEGDVYDTLEDVRKRFPIDEDRVYLTGLSMGGGGAIWLGLTRPDVWAAVAPVCPAPPAEAEALAGNGLNLPFHFFHGDADPVVPVGVSRLWHKRFLGFNVKAEYVEYPGVRHNSWDNAYQNAAIFEWFGRHRRNRYPARVRYTARYYRHSSAYWVQLDGLTPGRAAFIDARFTGNNRIHVETDQLDGFTLRLDGHPGFERAKPVELVVDDKVIRAQGAELSWRKVNGEWQPGRYAFAPGEKRPGAEGPMMRAISGRHVYIYGTADSPSTDELDYRRRIAAEAADWSWSRFRPNLDLRVAADRDVAEYELNEADLVLFGTRQTNKWVARWADRLPVELQAGAADYGLVQVIADGQRHILISSGLPWWRGAGAEARPAARYLPLTPRLVSTFADYLLFRGSLSEVIAEGHFDRNWKLPPEDRKKIQATGAASIH